MMIRPKKRLEEMRESIAQFVSKSWTALEPVRHMVRNPWSKKQSKAPRLVRGCLECGVVYELSVFYWGTAKKLDTCPSCTGPHVLNLGQVPETTESSDGVYLIGRNGFCTGPYDSEEVAQDNVWDWYVQKEQSYGCQKSTKETHKEGGEEGHQEDFKEKRRKAWGHLRLLVSENKVRFPGEEERSRLIEEISDYRFEGRGHDRRLDDEDVEGQEVEREDPDQAS